MVGALHNDEAQGANKAHPEQGREPGARYPEAMAVKPVLTAEELFERVRHAPPPSEDDVTTLWDGTRIDSKEAAIKWLLEVDEARSRERAEAADGAGN